MVAGSVVRLGGLWAFVVGDGLGVLNGAAVLQVGGDAGCPKAMVANGFGQVNGLRSPFNHSERIVRVHRPERQLLRLPGG